jgi:16S rRNA (guanine966-N2)-methyltransferase
MLRIGAGDQKGRQLRAPEGRATRPTSARVREALFGILGPRLPQATWLDLYAGSGITGLEALCRGAQWASFVENHADARRCITHNIRLLGFTDRTEVISSPADRYLRRKAADTTGPRQFDLVFADPPYRQTQTEAAVERLLLLCQDSGKIAPRAWLIIEHAATADTPDRGGRWERGRTYHYGESALTLYRPSEGPQQIPI